MLSSGRGIPTAHFAASMVALATAAPVKIVLVLPASRGGVRGAAAGMRRSASTTSAVTALTRWD